MGERETFTTLFQFYGLIQIEMLMTIEQMTGQSIMELFDWVVATSTGAILVLGMIYGQYNTTVSRVSTHGRSIITCYYIICPLKFGA